MNIDKHGNSLSGTIDFSFGADGAAEVPATLEGLEADGNAEAFTFTIAGHAKLPDGTLAFTKVGDHYEYIFSPADPDASSDSISAVLTIRDGDGDEAEATLTLANPNPALSDDAAAESSDAGYLIADDSLDDLIGADSGYSPTSVTSSGADISQLTEQETLVLEQAMRQVENQMS